VKIFINLSKDGRNGGGPLKKKATNLMKYPIIINENPSTLF
jgi:hypothetical protein